jgi:molybdenum cofactor cytidylyltransferase
VATRVAGVILAGGAGTRFGGPKAFARLPDGRTFLAACADALVACGVAPVVATLPPGAPTAAPNGVIAVPLAGAGLPMFESLACGLARLLPDPGWERVVVLPVDHPLVRPATVRALAAADAEAAIPAYRGKHGHPIAIGRTVAERVARGELVGPTLREVLRAVATVEVAVDDPGVTANCNTPEALAAALAADGPG